MTLDRVNTSLEGAAPERSEADQALHDMECSTSVSKTKGAKKVNKTDTRDVWELLEEAPKYAQKTADLYYWSTNFDAGRGPFTLYLDLIGWSTEQLGEPIYSLADASLGYMELDKLAGALDEYSDRPADVMEFVNALMEAEAGE